MAFKGSCLCRGVCYEVAVPPVYTAYCHCSQCRKFSGSAFSAFAGVPLQSLTITQGADLVVYYEKTPQTSLAHCVRCGSSLFARKQAAGMAHVRLGTVDCDFPFRPLAHLHVSSKASWYSIPNDGLPRFDTLPSPEILAAAIRAANAGGDVAAALSPTAESPVDNHA